MAYVIVEDVAASWEQYAHLASALSGPAPAGLIVHVAGPTDEGFRVVALWESEEAWRRFAEREGSATATPVPLHVVRALQPEHVVYGEGSRAR